MISTPGPEQQFDGIYNKESDCGIPVQGDNQATFGPIMDENDLLNETCDSLDPEGLNSLMFSINEYLGPHNFLWLFNGQDLNSNMPDPNLNHMETGQPPSTSFVDPVWDQEHPQDMQDIFLRQVKTEDDS